jgi:hypothetical protein
MSAYFQPCESVACPLVFPSLRPSSFECLSLMGACDACSRAFFCQTSDKAPCPIASGLQGYKNYCHRLISHPDYTCALGEDPWQETVECKSEIWNTTYVFAVVDGG